MDRVLLQSAEEDGPRAKQFVIALLLVALLLLLLTPSAHATAGPNAPRSVAGSAANRANVIAWKAPIRKSSVCVVGYHIYRAKSATGPFMRVSGRLAEPLAYADQVRTPRAYFCFVRAISTRRVPWACSRGVSSVRVQTSAAVGKDPAIVSAAIRAGTLASSAGTLASPTLVSVIQVADASASGPPDDAIRVASHFRFSPDGPLGAPARVTLHYRAPMSKGEWLQ